MPVPAAAHGHQAVPVKIEPNEPEVAVDYSDLARVADRLLTPVAVVVADGTVRYANAVAAALLELTPDELVGRDSLDYVHPDDRDRVRADLDEIARGTRDGGFAKFRLRGNRRQLWREFHSYAHNLLDDPAFRGILVSGGDVTEKEQISRALRTLSKSNRVLIHATDEVTLVEEVCQTIVDSGEYLLAWVGYVEHNEERTVRRVAAHGATEYLEGLHVSWANDQYGQGPTGLAIRTGTTALVKDQRRSKKCKPWRARMEHFGVRTSCSFPLVVGDETIGALSIYSREVGTFGHAEIEMFAELANNLAYGIGRLRDAELLAQNEAHLREAERLAHVGHWEWNLRTGVFAFLADEIFSIHGIHDKSWHGDYDAFLDFVVPEDRGAFQQAIDETLTSGSASLTHRIVGRDGVGHVVRSKTEAINGKDGRTERIVGVSLDVTVHSNARKELDESRLFLLAITDNMAEGMIATDCEGVVTFANAAASRLFHLSTIEMIGHMVRDVFRFQGDPDETTSDPPCPLGRVWSDGLPYNAENKVVVRRDGSHVHVAFSASPLVTNGLSGAVIVFEDVTDRANEQLKVERELEKLAWVGRVRDALDNERFVLYSQPIVDLSTYEVVQHELLIRMVTPEGDVVLPAHFLPTAEEYGLVAEMDRWVVNETARLAAGGFSVEFNLSAKSVADPHMLATIIDAIDRFGAEPANMVCEITETTLVQDIDAAEAFVRGLNQIGCKVALDDFGAGYGGFAYLKRLPVSYLKIDREFVGDLCEETSSRHVVSAVVNLARAFGMQTIAEGAENDATLRLLKELGVDFAQGYVIGRPTSARDALIGDS
jgi:PAS domain S-box-containing protein